MSKGHEGNCDRCGLFVSFMRGYKEDCRDDNWQSIRKKGRKESRVVK